MALELILATPFSLDSIQMPVMDGFEATRRIRSLGYIQIPIIGLTASVSRSDFMEFGFNEWLPKPTRMKDLKAKLYGLHTSSTSIGEDPQ